MRRVMNRAKRVPYIRRQANLSTALMKVMRRQPPLYPQGWYVVREALDVTLDLLREEIKDGVKEGVGKCGVYR
jgi:hypothetical protein